MNRKEFFKQIFKLGSGIVLGGTLSKVYSDIASDEAQKLIAQATEKNPLNIKKLETFPDLAVTEGEEQRKIVRVAIDAIGGMKRFVKTGANVVIKPNIGWDRIPVQCADTSPEVVGEVVKLCFEAGAKSVLIFDNPLNDPRACYKRSGIEDAAKKEGAIVEFAQERFFKTIDFPGTEFIKKWQVYTKVLEADCFINIPVAKHHNSAGLTLAMKNNMGAISGNRGLYHQQMDLSIAELCTQIKPHLTILDAYRLLLRNGPQGGSLRDVKLEKKCVVGINQVSVDAYGATLFNKKPEDIGHIKIANKMGLGEINLDKLTIKKISV